MRKMLLVGMCLLSTMMACGESAKDAVNAFQDSMAKGQFVLRNFSGEDKVHAAWIGTMLQMDEPRWRTLGVLVVDSVELSGENSLCVVHGTS